MGNWKTPGHRGYVADLGAWYSSVCVRAVPIFSVSSVGHIEHGNGDDLRFSCGRLMIEANYQL